MFKFVRFMQDDNPDPKTDIPLSPILLCLLKRYDYLIFELE